MSCAANGTINAVSLLPALTPQKHSSLPQPEDPSGASPKWPQGCYLSSAEGASSSWQLSPLLLQPFQHNKHIPPSTAVLSPYLVWRHNDNSAKAVPLSPGRQCPHNIICLNPWHTQHGYAKGIHDCEDAAQGICKGRRVLPPLCLVLWVHPVPAQTCRGRQHAQDVSRWGGRPLSHVLSSSCKSCGCLFPPSIASAGVCSPAVTAQQGSTGSCSVCTCMWHQGHPQLLQGVWVLRLAASSAQAGLPGSFQQVPCPAAAHCCAQQQPAEGLREAGLWAGTCTPTGAGPGYTSCGCVTTDGWMGGREVYVWGC